MHGAETESAQDCVFDLAMRNNKRDAMVAGTPETFFMICLISRAASETCWVYFEIGHERSVHARWDK